MGLIEQRFQEWTQGKNSIEARVSIFQKIRDIPYAVIPELVSAERYTEILKLNKGSCTPKHFLLGNMFQRLGLMVLYAVYPYRWGEGWDDINMQLDFGPGQDYLARLRKMAEEMPLSHHLACRVDIDGELVLVDATLDLALGRIGMPVNQAWDGMSDTLLPMNPCGEEELYHPSEAYLMQAEYNEKQLAFYREFNSWLEKVRSS